MFDARTARVTDMRRTGGLEPDIGDREEQGWTEREEVQG